MILGQRFEVPMHVQVGLLASKRWAGLDIVAQVAFRARLPAREV